MVQSNFVQSLKKKKKKEFHEKIQECGKMSFVSEWIMKTSYADMVNGYQHVEDGKIMVARG
jgi:hypothetical protein